MTRARCARPPRARRAACDSSPSPTSRASSGAGSSRCPHRALDRRGDHQRAHACARGRVVVDVDPADTIRTPSAPSRLRSTRRCCRRAAGRAEPRRPTRPALNARDSPVSRCSSPNATTSSGASNVERRPRLALVLDRRADGCDLGGRRAAAAADHLRAEVARMRGELAEVLGRRMRIDDAAARRCSRARRSGARRAASRSAPICSSAASAARRPAP